jgi:hypothetical protein
MSDRDELVDALAVGLRQRVLEQRRAAERLADFAFTEGPLERDRGATDGPTDWRYFVTRTLAAAGQPATIALLEALADGDRPLAELAGPGDAGARDPLALADRVGGLSAAGLVDRELVSDRVALTGLGRAVLELVREWETRAAAVGAETVDHVAAATSDVAGDGGVSR